MTKQDDKIIELIKIEKIIKEFIFSEDVDKCKDNDGDVNHRHDNKIDECEENKNDKCNNNNNNVEARKDSKDVVRNDIMLNDK